VRIVVLAITPKESGSAKVEVSFSNTNAGKRVARGEATYDFTRGERKQVEIPIDIIIQPDEFGWVEYNRVSVKIKGKYLSLKTKKGTKLIFESKYR